MFNFKLNLSLSSLNNIGASGENIEEKYCQTAMANSGTIYGYDSGSGLGDLTPNVTKEGQFIYAMTSDTSNGDFILRFGVAGDEQSGTETEATLLYTSGSENSGIVYMVWNATNSRYEGNSQPKADIVATYVGEEVCINVYTEDIVYNSTIAYDGSTETNVNTRELLDLTVPKYNAPLAMGRGIKFNGTNQGCVVELPHTLGVEIASPSLNAVSTIGATLVDNLDGTWELRVPNTEVSTNIRLKLDYNTTQPFPVVITTDILLASGSSKFDDVQYGEGPWLAPIPNDNFIGDNVSEVSVRAIEFNFNSDTSGIEDVYTISRVSVKEVTQEELHLYKYNTVTEAYDYEKISTPTPYYDLGKENGIGDYIANTYNSVLVTKSVLTPEQITYQHYNPEKFLYYDGTELQSKILSDSELANVVTYMPMRDNDDYARDYAHYSEGAEIITDLYSNSANLVVSNKTATSCTLVHNGDEESYHINMKDHIALSPNAYYVVSLKMTSVSGTLPQRYSWWNGVGVEYVDVYEGENIKVLFTTDPMYYIFRLYMIASEVSEVNLEYSCKEITGTNQITNYTESCNVKDLLTGRQTIYDKVDTLGTILGTDFNTYQMNGEAPALRLPLTDTELWNGGTGFVIEFVIERISAGMAFLLYAIGTNTGFRITDQGWSDNIDLMLWNSDGTTAQVQSSIDGNPHHIAFEVSPTEMTMIVDGVAGSPVAHSFVPSGLNFADSTQVSPVGQMPMFKIWMSNNYKAYDRTRSWVEAQAVIAAQ